MTKNVEAGQPVLEALEKLKKDTEKAKEKRDARRYQEITVPFTLEDGLSRYTKDELTSIRRHHDLRGVSNFKKGELQALLIEKLPMLLEEFYMTIDEERYELLQRIAARDGIIPLADLKEHQIEYWFASGMLFPGQYEGERVLVMPKEILEKFVILDEEEKFKETFARNSEWIRLTHGMLYYYGSLDVTQLIKFLENQYRKGEFSAEEYFRIMTDAVDYYKTVKNEDGLWANIRVFDAKIVQEEHNKRKDLPFYPFSKETLLQAGAENYVEKNTYYEELTNFIFINFGIKRDMADKLVEESVFATRSGANPANVIAFLENYLDFSNEENFRKLADKVVALMDNTRMWFFKGHTKAEISKNKQQVKKPLPNTKKKIGRNEKCPCGSNKKYKKCCGR